MAPVTRRLISSLAVLFAVVGGIQHASGQTVVAGPTTAELTGAAGDRVTIPIGIDMTGAPGVDLGAYRITFSWNPAGLSFVNATGGTFGSPAFNTDSAANGEVQFAAASAAGANGIFTLANITLEVNATLSGVFTVVFDELTAANTFDDLLPYLTVTQGSFCGSDVWGDMNGNGQIQSVDAQMVLMHSVGLPVADTTRGDVDPDGVVDPRDALVILSYVVGLDVSAFRVGEPVSQSCTPGAVDTVKILPEALSLAPGDEFQLTAEVEDSNGVQLGGKNLSWSSNDGAVALVDSAGTVFAQGPGTATVTAAVSPGVSGTATVTVGARHRWVVNPAGAQGQQSEVGSDTYPFSTIEGAVEAAGDGDTVFIHVGTYHEPLDASGFNGLVFEGDSGASGMPTISVPDRSVGSLAGTGKLTLRRLDFAESAAGLDIIADSLEVESVTIRSMRSQGLSASLSGAARFREVSVSSVADIGLAVGTSGKVTAVGVAVSGVDSVGQLGAQAGLFFETADTIIVDSSEVRAVRGHGIMTQGTSQYIRVNRSTILGFEGTGIAVDTAVTLDVSDSVLVELGGGDGIDVHVVDTLRVADATLRDISDDAVDIELGPYQVATFTDVLVERAGSAFIAPLVTGGRASVVNSRITDTDGYGMELDPDTLIVEQVVIERTGNDAINGDNISYARIVDSRLLDVSEGIDLETSGYVEILRTAVHGVRGDDAFDIIGADSIVLVNDTATGVSADHGAAIGDALVFRMRDSHISATEGPALSVSDVLDVEIVNITVDSTEQSAYAYYGGGTVHIYYADVARLDSSRIQYSAATAVYVEGTSDLQMYGNTLSYNVAKNGYTSGWGGNSYRVINTYSVNSARIRNNNFLYNRGSALVAQLSAVDEHVVFDSNTVRGGYDAVYAAATDSLTGSVEIRGNQIVGDLTAADETQMFRLQPLRSVVIEDNALDSVAGLGFGLYRVDSAFVRSNTATNMDTRSNEVMHTLDVSNLEIDGNTISCTGEDGSRRAITAWDGGGMISNNVVTDCRYGIRVGGEYVVPATTTVSNNRIIWTVADERPAHAIYVQYPLSRVDILNNFIDGGDFTDYAIYVLGNGSYHLGRVEIVGDTLSGTAGTGIYVTIADTVVVDGNVLNSLDPGASTGRKAVIWLANTYDSTQVTRNTITGNPYPGILFSSSVQNVFVDTNLVTGNDTGMVFGSTPSAANTVFGTWNHVSGNDVGIATYDNNVHFTVNNIVGNRIGFYIEDADTVDVAGNWWGDASGPRCDPIWSCNPESVGDSLTGWTGTVVLWSPAAEAEYTLWGAPAGGAPALTPRRLGYSDEPRAPSPAPPPAIPVSAYPALMSSVRVVSDGSRTGERQ